MPANADQPAVAAAPFARLLHRTPVRYLLTGGTLFLLDLLVFLALTGAGLAVPPAQVCSRATGAVAGFFGHKFFTFRGSGGRQALSSGRQAGGYLAITVGNLVLSPWVVSAAITACGGARVPGKMIAEVVLVGVVWALNRFIFRPAPEGA